MEAGFAVGPFAADVKAEPLPGDAFAAVAAAAGTAVVAGVDSGAAAGFGLDAGTVTDADAETGAAWTESERALPLRAGRADFGRADLGDNFPAPAPPDLAGWPPLSAALCVGCGTALAGGFFSVVLGIMEAARRGPGDHTSGALSGPPTVKSRIAPVTLRRDGEAVWWQPGLVVVGYFFSAGVFPG